MSTPIDHEPNLAQDNRESVLECGTIVPLSERGRGKNRAVGGRAPESGAARRTPKPGGDVHRFWQPQVWLVMAGIMVGSQALPAADVELDSPSTPAGYVSLLLINEAPFPGERGYRSEEDTKATMLAVLWVLDCRARAVPPGYTQKQIADVETRSIIDVMTAGGVKGQVDGFYKDSAGRPVAVPRVHERIRYLLNIANQGQPGKVARLLLHGRDLTRLYFQRGPAAKDIFAELRKVGSVYVTGRSYAWMTDARGFDPGGSFVRIPDTDQGSLGGNRFYTLEKRK
jgi:hypothetical protein